MSEASRLSPSDERLFAGLSYLFGLVVALLIWGTQKDRSPLVRFHALQAIGLDVLFLIVGLLGSGYLTVFTFALMSLMVSGIIAAGVYADPQSTAFLLAFVLPAGLPMLMLIPVILWIGAVFFVRIYAAVKVLQGNNFRFPVVGRQIEGLVPV